MRWLTELTALPWQVFLPESTQTRLGIPTLEERRRKEVLQHARGLVLDVGCGPNRLIHSYRAGGGRGLGCDVFSWDGVDLLCDAAALPIRSGSFDTVTLVACLNHIPRRTECLSEVARVLVPDGRLLVTMIPTLVGTLSHKLMWWDPDLRHRGMCHDELYGMSDSHVIGLAHSAGLALMNKENFIIGLNRIFVFEKSQSCR